MSGGRGPLGKSLFQASSAPHRADVGLGEGMACLVRLLIVNPARHCVLTDAGPHTKMPSD